MLHVVKTYSTIITYFCKNLSETFNSFAFWHFYLNNFFFPFVFSSEFLNNLIVPFLNYVSETRQRGSNFLFLFCRKTKCLEQKSELLLKTEHAWAFLYMTLIFVNANTNWINRTSKRVLLKLKTFLLHYKLSFLFLRKFSMRFKSEKITLWSEHSLNFFNEIKNANDYYISL